MKKYKKNKKSNKKIFLLCLLLIVTIGYALLTAVLKINGLTGFRGQRWKIIWDNVEVVEGSVDGNVEIISPKKTSIAVSASFEDLGDYYEFTVDAVNEGDFDAMVDVISADFYKVEEGEADQQIAKPKYLKYSLTYSDGRELKQGSRLNKHTSKKYRVRVEYDESITNPKDLPEDIDIKCVITIDYVQALTSGVTLKPGPDVSNIFYNLAYESNKEDIGSLCDPEEYPDDEYCRMGNISSIAQYINAIKLATPEQYNLVKDDLTVDNLISLSTDKPNKTIKIATNAAVEADTVDADEVYAWYDKETETIYYYTDEDKIYLNPDSSYFFYHFDYLEEIDMSKFDTSLVKNFTNMFEYCYLDVFDFSNWDTSSAETMEWMFYYTSTREPYTLDLSSFNTSNVTNMNSMFRECSVNNVILSSFDTSKVTDMGYMFAGAGVYNLDISNFDTSNVTNMEAMFNGLGYVENVDLSHLKTGNVTNMSYMLSGTNFNNLDLSHFNTSKVTSMSSMFYASDYTSLDLSHFDTRKVTAMDSMFSGCGNLESINLSSFDTSKVTDMDFMFSNCGLVTLDISNFNTSRVIDMYFMFSNSNSLETVYVGDGWDTTNVDSYDKVFSNVPNLKGTYGTTYDVNHQNKEYARIDSLDAPGYFCDKSKIIIKYNANGGTVSPEMKQISYGDAVGNLPTPTYGNNPFLGWYTGVTDGDLIDDPTYVPTVFLELIARWQYTITFDANGGNVDTPTRTLSSGNKLGALPTPTKANMGFAGWYTEREGGTLVNLSTIPENSVTYYAHWEPNVSVTYDANDGTFTDTSSSKTITYSYQNNDVVRYSHTPNIDDNGVATGKYERDLNRNDIVTVPNSDILTIDVWFSTENEYNDWLAIYPAGVTPQTYNYEKATISGGRLGGGRSETKPTDEEYHRTYLVEGDTVQFFFRSDSSSEYYGYYAVVTGHQFGYHGNVSYEVPTKDLGYRFEGWNTERDGSGTTYNSESEIINALGSSNITLYAQWYAFATVECNGQYYDTLKEVVDAVSTTDPNTTVINLLKDTTEQIIVKSGQNIKINLRGNTITYNASNVIKNSGTLEINNGNILCAAGAGAIDVESTGTLNVINVNIAATGSRQALYNNGGNVTISGNCEFSAESSERATVHNLNNGTMIILGGTYTSTNQQALKVESGSVIIGTDDGIVNRNSPVFQGATSGITTGGTFTFYDGTIKGIDSAVDNESNMNYDSTNYDLVRETQGDYKVIYLNSHNKYTVTLDPGEGDVEPTSISVSQGAEVGELPTPTRTGYIFVGWYTATTGGNEVDSTYVPTDDVTIYARWQEKTGNTVTFNPNGGTVSPTSKEVLKGQAVGELPTPTRTGYEFLGWYLDLQTGIALDNSYIPTSDVTLIAKWNNFPVVFSHEGACTFGDTNASGNITGSTCSADYVGRKYIDTGISLYNTTNYQKDYEIGFTIVNYDPTIQVKQATFVNAKSEDKSRNWPGLTYRRDSETNNLELTETINGTKESRTTAYTNVESVRIVRISGQIKYAYNGGELQDLQDMSAFNQYFELSTWFGASPTDATGSSYQRVLKGTLSNMYIKLGTYEAPTQNKYKVTFNANSGTVSPTSKEIDIGDAVGALPTPTRPGYDFVGWYTAVTDGTEISSSTVPTGNVTYYAHWTYACVDFDNDSWSTIMSNIASDPNAYPLGCKKAVDMGSLGTHYLRIANTSTPAECSGSGFSETACGVVFEFADTFGSYRMNPRITTTGTRENGDGNKGGWKYSEIRPYVNSTVYNALPDVIKNRIITTTVVSGHGSQDSTNFVTEDKLYFLSMKEIWGVTTTQYISLPNESVGETRQLDYYNAVGAVIDNFSPAAKGSSYWLRSADINSDSFFLTTSQAGVPWNSYAEYNDGISPAFRVR